MATTGDLTKSRSTCRRLRWKGMFIDVEPDPSVPWGVDDFCWCAKTQRSLGPDGGVVEKKRCVAGRECFEAVAVKI